MYENKGSGLDVVNLEENDSAAVKAIDVFNGAVSLRAVLFHCMGLSVRLRCSSCKVVTAW